MKILGLGAGFVGGVVCIAGGIYLVSLRAVQDNIVAALASGIGVYRIGKGLYAIASTTLPAVGRGE